MAVSAPVEIATFGSLNTVTTSNATLTSGAAVGDLVFITIHNGGATSTIGVTDTKGHAWTLSSMAGTSGAPANNTYIAWTMITTALTTADSITITRAPSGGVAWVASKVSGASGVISGATAATGTTQAVAGGTVTADAGALVIMAITCRDSINITPGTGYTTSSIARSSGTGNPRGGGYIYRNTPTAETTTPTGTLDINLAWSGVYAEILPGTVDPEPTGIRVIEYNGTTSTTMKLMEWDGDSWAELALTIEPAGLGTLAIIGDSNTYRDGPPPFGSRETTTRSRLIAAGWEAADIYWYGAGGKDMLSSDQYSKTTLQNITDAVTQLGHVDRMVIALGTNDTPKTTAQFAADMNTILDACETAGVGEVIWMNLAYKAGNNTNSVTFNPVITSTIGARSVGTLADWHTQIHATDYSAGDWITEDGTHYTVQGYEKRDTFTIQKLNTEQTLIEALPLMGGYLGTPSEAPDERYLTAFGAYPEISTSYYQASGRPGGTINLPYEQSRVAHGTIPLITVTSVNGPYTMAQIAAGNADAWIDYWGNQFNNIGGEVWFTFDHEFEVKLNQNKWSPAPTIAEYAAAYNRFIARVKVLAPQAKSTYWYGYSDTAKIGSVGSAITPPDIIALDPYVFSHHASGTTFEQMVNPKLTWLRAQPWYQGQPIILAEYAKDTVFGDNSVASFLTNIRQKMIDVGLFGAVYFCRDKPGDIMANISATAWPQAGTAYRDSQVGTP